MKKTFTAFSILILLVQFSFISYSQTTYYSIAPGGSWNDTATWGTSSGGPGGAGVPTGNDDVILQAGAPVSLAGFGAASCRNLYFEGSATSILLSLGGFSALTINGTLLGYNGVPGTDLIEASTGALLNFTGISLNTTIYPQLSNNEIIALWNGNAPLPWSVFDLSGSAVLDLIVDDTFTPTNLVFRSRFTLREGTLSFGVDINNMIFSHPSAQVIIEPGATLNSNYNNQIRIRGDNARLEIQQGGTLNAAGPVNGDGPLVNVNIIEIYGTLVAERYVNSDKMVIRPTGSLITYFSYAPNQTEGWWYQSNSPGLFTLEGTVQYASTSSQKIYTVSNGYGNLILSGGGNKTWVGPADPQINRNFTVGSAVTSVVGNGDPFLVGGNFTNNSSWAPAADFIFIGGSNQTINGISSLTFNGDLILTDSLRTVSLGNQNIVLNGNLQVSPNATFDPGIYNVTITGDIIALGTLRAGTSSSTFNFTDSTNCIGSGASFNNFTINNGGAFSASTVDPFSVAGNFTNNGAFYANNGTVIFNGPGSQSITETQKIEFSNLTINNTSPAIVNVNGDVDLTGRLSLATPSSRFDADGTGGGIFTLKSTGINQDAAIAALPAPANFLGNVTIERYVDGIADVNNNWRFLSVPITNANVAMWQDDFPVTGNFSNPSTTSPETPIPDPGSASIIYWDPTQAPYYFALGSGASTGATSLENGRGYQVYTYRTSDFVVSTRGTIGKGGISKSVSPNAWAMMGNPYPSTIDWDNMTTTGLYGSVYLQNIDGSFATYVKGSGLGSNHPNSGWAGEISAGQAFWIYSEGATSLNFAESNKTASPNYEFLRIAEPENLIRIALSNDKQKDEILIRFTSEAKDGFESQMDALKFKNGVYQEDLGRNSYINLSSYVINPEEDMAINSIPFIEDCQKTLFLNIEDVPEGNYKLAFNNLESFQLGYKLQLVDHFTDEIVDLDGSETYHFNVTTDSASFGNARFEIKISADMVNRSYDFVTNNGCSQNFVNVTIDHAVAGTTYEIYRGGQLIGDPVTADNSQVVLHIPKDKLEIGTTEFNLGSSLGSCEDFIENAFVVEYDTIYEIIKVEDYTLCGSGTAVLRAEGAPADGYYRWYENESDQIPIMNETQSELFVDNLEENRTYYVTAVNATGCESSVRRAVNITVEAIPDIIPTVQFSSANCMNSPVEITASGAPSGGSYIWYDQYGNILSSVNEGAFVTPALKDSTVFYVAIANSQDCPGEKVRVEIPVIKTDMPVITEENGILTSNYSDNIQWYKNNVIIPGATKAVLDTKLESGSYTLEYDNGTCTVKSEPVLIEGVTGLEDVENSPLINLFPNPASNRLFVEYNKQTNNTTRLLIYTTEGKLMDSMFMEKFNNGHKQTLDINRYPQGIYITVVYDHKKYVYSKFRKQ